MVPKGNGLLLLLGFVAFGDGFHMCQIFFCLLFPLTEILFPLKPAKLFLLLFQGVFDLLALLIQLLQLVAFLGDFFIVQNLNAFNLLLGILPNLLLLYSLLKDFSSNSRVGIHTCDFLQNLGFLIVLAVEKSGELALCQEGGTAELLEIQTDGEGYLLTNLLIFGIGKIGIQIAERPFLVLYLSRHLVAGSCHRPLCLVMYTVAARKGKAHESLTGIAAHQLHWVFNLDIFFVVTHFSLHARVFETGSAGIERQTDGIEEG